SRLCFTEFARRAEGPNTELQPGTARRVQQHYEQTERGCGRQQYQLYPVSPFQRRSGAPVYCAYSVSGAGMILTLRIKIKREETKSTKKDQKKPSCSSFLRA